MIRFFWYFQMTDLIGAAAVKPPAAARRRPQLVRRPFAQNRFNGCLTKAVSPSP
jgi:hypothetical protein